MPPLLNSIPRPPFGSTPLARPSGNPGAAAQAASKVKQAVDLLESALTELPVGEPLHKATVSAISGLSKHLNAQNMSPGVNTQTLMQLLAQAKQQAPMAPFGMQPPGAAPSGPPGGIPPGLLGAGGPPSMPPPGAG